MRINYRFGDKHKTVLILELHRAFHLSCSISDNKERLAENGYKLDIVDIGFKF